MGEIRIENLDLVYKAEEGNTILDLNLENDVDHANDCGGNCACSTCKIVVISGSENLSEQEEFENKLWSILCFDKSEVSPAIHSAVRCGVELEKDALMP